MLPSPHPTLLLGFLSALMLNPGCTRGKSLSVHKLNTPQRKRGAPARSSHCMTLSSPTQLSVCFPSALPLTLGSASALAPQLWAFSSTQPNSSFPTINIHQKVTLIPTSSVPRQPLSTCSSQPQPQHYPEGQSQGRELAILRKGGIKGFKKPRKEFPYWKYSRLGLTGPWIIYSKILLPTESWSHCAPGVLSRPDSSVTP